MWSKKEADTSIRGLPFYVKRDTFSSTDKKYKIGYILSLFLVIGMMCVIFQFSAADATQSSHLSEGICIRIVREISSVFPESFPTGKAIRIAEFIEYPVRKCAHFTEYAVLSIMVNSYLWLCYIVESKAKQEKSREVSFWKFLLRAEVFCALYACSDELHQYFVPGRSCQFFDVCVDSAGALCGGLVFWGITRWYCTRRKKQEIYRVDEC